MDRLHSKAFDFSLDDGWTLVELTIVLVVLGILMAIGIPTFAGARRRSEDRAAESDLRVALIAANGIYATQVSYECALAKATSACPKALPQGEPALDFTTKASTAAAPFVSVWKSPTTLEWAAARMSASGTCFGIREVQMGAPPSTVGTWYGESLKTCTGAFAAKAAKTPDRQWT